MGGQVPVGTRTAGTGIPRCDPPAVAARFVLLLLLGIVARRIGVKRAQRKRKEWTWFVEDGPAFAALLIGLYLVLWAPMWLPTEELDMGANGTEVAHVLATGDGWTTLLRTSDRLILRVPSSTVVERTICNSGERRSLAQIVTSSLSQPRCATPASPARPGQHVCGRGIDSGRRQLLGGGNNSANSLRNSSIIRISCRSNG